MTNFLSYMQCKCRVALLALLAMVLTVALVETRPARAEQDSDVIAVVGAEKITRKDLETAVAEHVKTYQQDDNAVRLTLLKDMILRSIANQRMTQKTIDKNPALIRRLETLRRSELFQAYVNENLLKIAKAVKVEPSDVDKYIASHPQYFQDRQTFHFGELIIDSGNKTKETALRDRLKLVAERKHLTPAEMDVLIQWLDQNQMAHGYLNDWRPTERLAGGLEEILPALEKKGEGLDISTRGQKVRVVALYGAYPDPVNPLFVKGGIAQQLAKGLSDQYTQKIIEGMLANGQVVLYDKSFADLNLPISRASPVAESIPLGQRILIIWNCALFLLAPMALYLFFRAETQPVNEGAPSSVFDRIFNHVAFRALVSLALAGFIGAIMYEVLDAAYGDGASKALILDGVLGLVIGAAVIAVAVFVGPVRNLLSTTRWLPASIIVAAQIATAMFSA